MVSSRNSRTMVQPPGTAVPMVPWYGVVVVGIFFKCFVTLMLYESNSSVVRPEQNHRVSQWSRTIDSKILLI